MRRCPPLLGVCYHTLTLLERAHRLSGARDLGGEKDVSTHRSNQANIEQLHREVEALAEEMSRPAPNSFRVTLLPFSIGAAFALALFAVVVFVAKHV